ncbi:MAG: alpha/beta fold hydrolase [Ignavibacteriales bacterium]
MPAKKVKVGDIDMAYMRLGNSSEIPIVLIIGCCTTMDMWNPSVLKELSSNRSVIIFDNRGAGETTLGTREFSIRQFANDTTGLLDQLKSAESRYIWYFDGLYYCSRACSNESRQS